MTSPVLYAKSGDIHIAYTVRGSGPDLVWCPGSLSHQEVQPQIPELAGHIDAVGQFARVIFFDKRGTGMSDRPSGIPTLEERIDDIRAVMDAAQSQRAHILGVSEGGSMACLFAATYPDRTRSLLLYGTRPRWTRAPDYPWGPTPEEAEANLQRRIAAGFKPDWSGEDGRRWLGPGLADDPAFLEQFDRLLRISATPAARIALARMNLLIDVRGILGSIRVPTLVVGKTGDPLLPPGCAQDLASRIPGARLVEIEGIGHLIGQNGPELQKIFKEWVTEVTEAAPSERFLATILFVDLVRSTERVAEIGDASWRDLLARYYTEARRELAIYGGREVDTAGDGLLAHFDGPGRAIRCAGAIERSARELGLEARAGVHTGEVERDLGALRGIAVHTAARIASVASPNEVLVSSTVRDLVAGSGLSFIDRGAHQLKGIEGARQLLAVG
ncbi:MAG TPA: alpha/beta fold hydrolase [Candidatus Limnocylindria bacterium]|nr:alpha/beta fold hydrolase [Candidatus Limnocylindria bacterium]